MTSLRKSVLLAVAAAAGAALPSHAAPAVDAVAGLPCSLVASSPVALVVGGQGTPGTLACSGWVDASNSAAESAAGLPLRVHTACGVVQVDDPVAHGISAACGTGPVTYSDGGFGADHKIYVCTYVDRGAFVYDADADPSNGTQCAEAAHGSTIPVDTNQGGVCLAVVVKDPAVVTGPWGPDGTCAGCLSGHNPVVDKWEKAVLEVSLLEMPVG